MLKRLIKIFLLLALVPITMIAIGVITVFVYHNGNKKNVIYDYGIVFGAALRGKGKLSGTLESRMQTAIRLYHEGSVKKLVLSGAKDPSEPMSMFQYALSKNVAPKDILLDEDGENTLKTIQNAKKKFADAGRILFISSSFHLARIKMTAFIIGIRNADICPSDTPHPKVISFVFRESLAIWYYLAKTTAIRLF